MLPYGILREKRDEAKIKKWIGKTYPDEVLLLPVRFWGVHMMDIIVSNDCISLLSNSPFTVIIELITFLFYHRKKM